MSRLAVAGGCAATLGVVVAVVAIRLVALVAVVWVITKAVLWAIR